MRIEEKLGSDGDDTALNGLRFRCNSQQKVQKIPGLIITIYEGLWGTWRNWHYAGAENVVYFDGFYFFDSFQVRFEPALGSGGDDTAMNGLTFTSLSLITAVAKNLRLSSEQQAILDQKLKLPLYEFWAQSNAAYGAREGNITRKEEFIGYWWGFTIYMTKSCFDELARSDLLGCSLASLGVPEV